MTVSEEAFASAWQAALGMSPDQRLKLAYPHYRTQLLGDGLAGKSPIAAIQEWYDEEFVPAATSFGPQIMHALRDVHTAHNLAMASVVADFLLHQLGFDPGIHVKELAAFILVIAAFTDDGNGRSNPHG